MTNYEKMLKSKEDCAEALFAYTIEYHFKKGALLVEEWLDKEYNKAEIVMKLALTLGKMRGNND